MNSAYGSLPGSKRDMYFPVAGVELNPIIPLIVGAISALIFSQVGLTGSIATLPFMMSVLNFTSPSVSSTNLIYNILTPIGGIYSYKKEKRLLWRLGVTTGIGGVMGALIGPSIRTTILLDSIKFKAVFGLILIFVGIRLVKHRQAHIEVGHVEDTSRNFLNQRFNFSKKTYSYNAIQLLIAGFLVGILSTTIGIGTGFLLVPFYTTILKLPIYAVTGAAIISTLIISTMGIIVYYSLNNGGATSPDIYLGLLIGVGGLIGGLFSAKIQPRFSSNFLHKFLGTILLLWAAAYLFQSL